MRLLTLYLLLFLAITLSDSKRYSNSHRHHHLRQNQQRSHGRSRQHVSHSHHHKVKHRQKQTAKTPKPSSFPTAFGPLAGPNTCFPEAKRFFPEVQKFDPVFMVGFSTQCATAEFKPNTQVNYVWANSTCDDKYPPVSQGSDFVFYWTPKYYSGPYQIDWWLYTESLSNTFTDNDMVVRLFNCYPYNALNVCKAGSSFSYGYVENGRDMVIQISTLHANQTGKFRFCILPGPGAIGG